MTMDDPFTGIKSRYQESAADSTELFVEILRVAQVIGLDKALAYLEECVIEKRMTWIEKTMDSIKRTNKPVWDGFQLFYENYLGLSVPEDGEIVERTHHKMISRWWNPCPTLDVCEKLGLDTKEVCRKAYHKPVQELLIQIDPKLQFDRNYTCIRPYTPYCEEIIYLET